MVVLFFALQLAAFSSHFSNIPFGILFESSEKLC